MRSLAVFLLIFFGALGLTMAQLDEKKLEKLEQRLDQARHENNELKEAEAHREIAKLYLKDEDYRKAVREYKREINVREKIGDELITAYSEVALGKAYAKWGKHDKAVDHYESALEVGIRKDKVSLIRSCYLLLSRSYRAMGVNSKANQYIHSYNNFKKERENRLLQKKISESEEELKEIEEIIEEKEEVVSKQEVELTRKDEEIKKKSTQVAEKTREVWDLSRQKEMQQKMIEQQEKVIEDEKTIIQLMVGSIVLMLLLVGVFVYFYIQKRKANRIIELQNKNITSSINHAFKIQSAILPKEGMLKKYLGEEHLVYYKPMSIVSGDFYFLHEHSEDEFYISAIDCTGHGVPGALTSMLGYSLLSEIVADPRFVEVNDILDELHNRIVKALSQKDSGGKEGMDLSLCKVNVKEKYIDYAGARNPLLYINSQGQNQTKASRRPIGGVIAKEFKPFTKTRVEITEPTTCYLYTDGYQDQFGGPENKKYLSKYFLKLLLDIHKEPFGVQWQILEDEYRNWKGDAAQNDDICILGFRVG